MVYSSTVNTTRDVLKYIGQYQGHLFVIRIDDQLLKTPLFSMFIKDVVFGTIERNDLILNELDKNLGNEFTFNNLDKLFQVILKSATYEFLYKPNLSINIIIKEYLKASNFFLNNSQTKYLNALLDNIAKKLRS